MGYDLHITRAREWVDSESHPITVVEWKQCVGNDSQMRLDGFAEAATSNGATIRIEADGLSVWTAYSKHGEGGNMAWFYWSRGKISVKNPDNEIRRKMHQLALLLSAHVQGDEGEEYGGDGEVIPDNPHAFSSPSKPWWRRLFGG